MSYYEVLRWVYDCLPTSKTSTRWKIAYFYASRIDPKNYEFIPHVFASCLQYNSKYVAFRKTFYTFAGTFEEKEAGQYLKSRYFRDPDYCTYKRY